MIGRRSFPFGEAYFQVAIPVLGRVRLVEFPNMLTIQFPSVKLHPSFPPERDEI